MTNELSDRLCRQNDRNPRQPIRYHPAEDAARLTCPLLICAAAEDKESPLENTRALANSAPRGELRVYPGTHFTFYTEPEFRDRVVADQIDFYRRASAKV